MEKKKRKERKEKKKRKKGQVVGEKNKGGMGEEISHFDQIGEGGIKKEEGKQGRKKKGGDGKERISRLSDGRSSTV